MYTSSFSIGSARLEPRPRWYQEWYQVPDFSYGKAKKASRVEPNRAGTSQWKTPLTRQSRFPCIVLFVTTWHNVNLTLTATISILFSCAFTK